MISRQGASPGKLVRRAGLARRYMQADVGRSAPSVVHRILKNDRSTRTINREMKGCRIGLGKLAPAGMAGQRGAGQSSTSVT